MQRNLHGALSLVRLAQRRRCQFAAAVSIVDFEAAIASWQVAGASPSPILRASAGMFGQACRLAAGTEKRREVLEAEAARDAQTKAAASQAAVAQVAQLAAAPAKRIRLSTIVDQSNDMEVDPLSKVDTAPMYEAYVRKLGAMPRPEEDVTLDQIDGLKALYASGEAPYVDLAVWGPFGRRVQKRLKMSGLIMGAAGKLQQAQVFGPPSIDEWLAGFAVFKTGSVLLGELTPATADHWMKTIQRYAQRYSVNLWPLVYQTDVRARLEHMERVRRQGAEAHRLAVAAGGSHPYDPAHPWEWTFRATADDAQFWRIELEEPAIRVVTESSAMADYLEDDAQVHGGRTKPVMQKDHQQASRGGYEEGRKRKIQADERVHLVDAEGNFTHNRRGMRLCTSYQSGTCTYPNCKYQHQCSRCLLQGHGKDKCTAAQAGAPQQKRKGKGKGKGKQPSSQN